MRNWFLAAPLIFMGQAHAIASVPVVAVFDIQNEAELKPEEIRQLTNYLGAELTASRKYSVVPSTEIKRALQQKKAESLEACYDESCQIEIGKEVAAEKTLATTISRLSSWCVITMQLYDLKRGASEKGATHRGRCSLDDIIVSLESAVTELTGRRKVKSPGAGVARQADESFGETRSDWNLGGSGKSGSIVYFRSKPSGAVVLVDGQLLCQKTPCSKNLTEGPHEVSMQRENYFPKSQRVEIRRGQKNELAWALSPNFGLVQITSSPSRIALVINGKKTSKTPIKKMMLPPGRHAVSIEDACYLRKGKKFSLQAGETKKLNFDLTPREAGIDVRVDDIEGNAIEANVYVGRKLLGSTPGQYKVPLCTKYIELRAQDYRSKRVQLSLKEKKLSPIAVQMTPARGAKMARYRRLKKEKAKSKREQKAKARRASKVKAKQRRQAEIDALSMTVAIQGYFSISGCLDEGTETTESGSSASGCNSATVYGGNADPVVGGGGIVQFRYPPRYPLQLSFGTGLSAYLHPDGASSSDGTKDAVLLEIPLTAGIRIYQDGYVFEPEIGYVYRSMTPSTSSNQLEVVGHCFSSGASVSMGAEGLELGAGGYYYSCEEPMSSTLNLRAWLGLYFDI